MLLSALLLRHSFTWSCGRIYYLCCCHVYLCAVGLVVSHNKTDNREVHMTTTQIEGTVQCTVHNKTDSREVHMTTTQIEDTVQCTVHNKTDSREVQHCTRNIPWIWSSVWPKHVWWHNRRRHSNVLKSDCVLVCILKHSAWAGFLNNVR